MPKIWIVVCVFILEYLMHVTKCEKKLRDVEIPARYGSKWSQFFIIGSGNKEKQNSNGYFYEINPNQSSGNQILPFNRYTRIPTRENQGERKSNAKQSNFNHNQGFRDHPHIKAFQANFQRIVPAIEDNIFNNETSYKLQDLPDITQANLDREGGITGTFHSLRTTSAALIKVNNKINKNREFSNQNTGHHKVNSEFVRLSKYQKTEFQPEEKDSNLRKTSVILKEKKPCNSFSCINNSTDFLRIFEFQKALSTSTLQVNKRINKNTELSNQNIGHQNVNTELARLSQNPQTQLQHEKKDVNLLKVPIILKDKKSCGSLSCINNLTDSSRMNKTSGRRNASQIVLTDTTRSIDFFTAKGTRNVPQTVFMKSIYHSSTTKNKNKTQSIQPVFTSSANIGPKYGTNLKFHKNDSKLEDNFQSYPAAMSSHKQWIKKISSTHQKENVTNYFPKNAAIQNKLPRFGITTSTTNRPLTSLTELLFYPRNNSVIEASKFGKLTEDPGFEKPTTKPYFGQRIKPVNRFSQTTVNKEISDQIHTNLDFSKNESPEISTFSNQFENNIKRKQYEKSLAELNQTIFNLFWNSERIPVQKESNVLILKKDATLENIKGSGEINSSKSEIKNDILKKSPQLDLLVNPKHIDEKSQIHSPDDEIYKTQNIFKTRHEMNHTAKEKKTIKNTGNNKDKDDEQQQNYLLRSYRAQNQEVERESNPSESPLLRQADSDSYKSYLKPTHITNHESDSPPTRLFKNSKNAVLKLKVQLLPLSKNETSEKSETESKSETVHQLHVFTDVFEKFPPYQIQSYYAPVQQYYIPPSHYHYPKYAYVPLSQSKHQNQFTLVAPSLQEWKQHELTKTVPPVVKKGEPLTAHSDYQLTDSFSFSKSTEKNVPITETTTIPAFEDKSSRVLRTTINDKLGKIREKEESDPITTALSPGSRNQMFHFGLSGSFKPVINIISAKSSKISHEVNNNKEKFGNQYHTETENYPVIEMSTNSKMKNNKNTTSGSLERKDIYSHLIAENPKSETSITMNSQMNKYFVTKIPTIGKQKNDLLTNLSISNRAATFQSTHLKKFNSTISTVTLPAINITTSSLLHTTTVNPIETSISSQIRSHNANIEKKSKTRLPFLQRPSNLFKNVTHSHSTKVQEMITLNHTKYDQNKFSSATDNKYTKPNNLRTKKLELVKHDHSSEFSLLSTSDVIRNGSDEIQFMGSTDDDDKNSTMLKHKKLNQNVNETKQIFQIISPMEIVQSDIEFATATPINIIQNNTEFITCAQELTTLLMTTELLDNYNGTQENFINDTQTSNLNNSTVFQNDLMFRYNNRIDLNKAFSMINSTKDITLGNTSNYVTVSAVNEKFNMKFESIDIPPHWDNKSMDKISENEYFSNFSMTTNENSSFVPTTRVEQFQTEDPELPGSSEYLNKDFLSSEKIVITNKKDEKESIHDNRTAQEMNTFNASVDIDANHYQPF
ncbi:uncharacterized protein NPIL_596791 [Nephila pilipes]|uniref:Uncharacterized protein n=1 Tax=Nephila pilipes TaxID=299642 RepID=A0A8X6PW21_NEPPI|nr:uncharacterized protein NPIL_596791 [Nephila pilipes]